MSFNSLFYSEDVVFANEYSTKMGKGEPVSMESMLKVCKALDCDIADVMEIEKDALQ